MAALATAAALLLQLVPTAAGEAAGRGVAPAPAVLVFSRTTGFRHDSIAAGQARLQALATAHGFAVELSEDPGRFTTAGLAPFAAVVFLNTTGDVLDAGQQQAFEAWLRAGGGYVGVHAAADTEYGWPFYGQLLGGNAWFQSHPAIQDAQLEVEAADTLAARHLPPRFGFRDEWYNFQANPRPQVQVLLRIDESSYTPGTGAMGADHPIAWRHQIDGGRSWYTALGHRIETYDDPRFARHLLGGVVWAAGDALLSTGFEVGIIR